MERNFICFTCHHKPIEFIILSCDHIICNNCLEHRTIKNDDQIIIHCRCGKKTLSNEDSMLLSLKTPEMAEVKLQLQKIKFLQHENTRISHFFTNQSDITSKQNTFVRNIDKNEQENFNNFNLFNNQKYTFNPCGLNYSKSFLKTQSLGLDQSQPFHEEDKQINLRKEKLVKGVKSVQSVHSTSPPSNKVSSKVSSKISPRKRGDRQTPKKISRSIYSSTGIHSSDYLNIIAKQLQKQLKYLEIQYQKQLQTCEKAFNKIKKSIHSTYDKLIGSLEKFYVSQVSGLQQNQPQKMDQIVLSIPKMVKKRYEGTVGKKIVQLGENLLEYFNEPDFKRCTQRQVMIKEATYARKSAQNIENYEPNRTNKSMRMNKKFSSSKEKNKECALYLAISPRKKNDQIVNYIQVIQKDPQTKISKKVKLYKKSIKEDRIRIY